MITRITTIWPTNIQLDCKDKAKRIVDMQKKIVDMQKASALLPHINKCLEPFSVFKNINKTKYLFSGN